MAWVFVALALSVRAAVAYGSGLTWLNQGWTPAQAKEVYRLYEGSQLMPLKWYLALELAGSTKKFSDNADAYGLVPLPGELPLGIAVFDDAETGRLYGENRWMGVNCAACHTGMVELNGRKVVIDGGQSLFDILKLEKDLLAGVESTLQSPAKFSRFATAVKAKNARALRTNLARFNEEFGGWVRRNHMRPGDTEIVNAFGPGRLDGLGGATNDLICRMTDRMGDEDLKKALTDPRNCESYHPGASLPHLWGMTREMYVQWNGAVHASLGRNYGQATATYGRNWIERGPKGKPLFRSTAHVDNLYRLEELFDDLDAPSWDDLAARGIVKRADPGLALAGRAHYLKHCDSCHALEPKRDWSGINSYWETQVFPTSFLGVENTYLDRVTNRTAYDADGKLVLASDLRAGVIGKMVLGDFKIHKTRNLRKLQLINCRPNPVQKTVGIKARPLAGVIFTAPYLHNGSVPTIYDLLSAERPSKFYLGCRKYDLVKMGYDCEKSPGNYEYETGDPGSINSSAGHPYGTGLSHDEKLELIEFMKTLRLPENPRTKPFCH